MKLLDLIREKLEERKIYKEALEDFHADDFSDEDQQNGVEIPVW